MYLNMNNTKKPLGVRTAILISTAPVDGYPPVQHQARILADNGFCVELITVPRLVGAEDVVFTCPGVRVTTVPLRIGRGLQTAKRIVDFASALLKLRSIYRNRPLI